MFESGKLLHVELLPGDEKTIIADSPTESKTYVVEFHECKDADGKNYKTVKIGEQWWTAENLAYDVGSNCKVHDDDENNILIYGRLYNWEAAKIACPNGWHLRSDDEWESLAQFISDQKGPYNKSRDDWQDLGKHLQTISGWYNEDNGTDDFGFSGIPGGYYYGSFLRLGMNRYWWSSTDDNSISWILNRYLQYSNNEFYRTADHKDYHYSVRCIKD